MVQLEAEADGRDVRTYRIIGAAIEVHRELGPGFLEAVYHDAMAVEFRRCQIPYRSQVALPIRYKGEQLRCSYRADFICFDEVLVELKALRTLSGIEEAQVINYLKASEIRVALLFNFGGPWLTHQRLVR